MTYCVVRNVYYGLDRAKRREKILKGASFDEAWKSVEHWCDEDMRFLNVAHGDGAFTDTPLWPSQKHCIHVTRIEPSLTYCCGPFRALQPREIVYEIWEEAEPDKNHKEENTMTNAELNKKFEDLAKKVDGYHDNNESLFRIRDEEVEKQIKKFEDRLDRCDENQSELNGELGRIEHRLDSMSDAGSYVRQVAEESKKIEDALKVTTRKLDLFGQKNAELMERNKRLSEQNVQLREDVKASNKMCDAVSKKASKLADRVQKLEADSSRTLRLEDLVWQHEDKLAKVPKLEDRMQQLETAQKQLRISAISTYGIPEKAKTIESMYPCLWNCEHKGKECNGQAQECPIAEHFSLGAAAQEYLEKWREHKYLEKCRANKKNIIFSEFNAGKRAIVFSDSDRLEKDYLDFCREFDKWCSTSETKDKLFPQSKWTTREKRMDPLMKCSSIYEDRSSFAIWVEHNDEEGEHTLEYDTLMTNWREYKTIGGLPYTEWSV